MRRLFDYLHRRLNACRYDCRDHGRGHVGDDAGDDDDGGGDVDLDSAGHGHDRGHGRFGRKPQRRRIGRTAAPAGRSAFSFSYAPLENWGKLTCMLTLVACQLCCVAIRPAPR